jgi:hypothetical protein
MTVTKPWHRIRPLQTVITGVQAGVGAGARRCQTKLGPIAPGIRLARRDGIPSRDQAMTVRHSASAAERLCL